MIFEVVETLDLDVEVALATAPDKSVGGDEIWESAEEQLRDVLSNRAATSTTSSPATAPSTARKIDFGFEDALGRVWDGPTVQLDFNMPDRFDLTYTGEDNEPPAGDDPPRAVRELRALLHGAHRALRRRLPLWLAPEQVRILPVSDETLGYAHRVKNELEDAGFRVEVEDRDWTVGRKIRAGHDDRLPYMVIVGEDEQEAGTVSVRDRFENQRGDVDLDAFVDHLVAERDEKRTEPEFVDAGERPGGQTLRSGARFSSYFDAALGRLSYERRICADQARGRRTRRRGADATGPDADGTGAERRPSPRSQGNEHAARRPPRPLVRRDHGRGSGAAALHVPDGQPVDDSGLGNGSASMEAAIGNLVEPGDTMLVPTNGYFGGRMKIDGRARGRRGCRGIGAVGRTPRPGRC